MSTYDYDDHSTIPFKLITLKPAIDGDKGVKAHRHHFYEFFFFEKGGNEHLIDFTNYPVHPDSVHIVPPGSVHLLKRNQHTKGFVLLFSPDFYQSSQLQSAVNQHRSFLYQYPFVPTISLSGSFNKIQALLEQMQREYIENERYSRESLHHFLGILLFKLQHIFEQSKQRSTQTSPQQATFYRFKTLLESHFTKNHQVKDYAGLLHLSPQHLNDITKQVIGKTAGAFIRERILLEARRLLWHSPFSVKEIAYRLNFEDPAYFGRMFKKYTGSTPQQFRVQIRKKYHNS